MGLSDVRYFVGVLDAGMLQKLKSYVDERMEESVLLKNAIKLCGRVSFMILSTGSLQKSFVILPKIKIVKIV